MTRIIEEMNQSFQLIDKEFPAFGKLLLNRTADHYFSMEDAVTAADCLLAAIGAELHK